MRTFEEIIEAIPQKPYYLDLEYGQAIYYSDCRLVLPHIPDKSIDLVLTDPPYNAGIDYGLYKDNLPEVEYIELLSWLVSEATRISHGILVFAGTGNLFLYPKPRFTLVWLKRNGKNRAGNIIHNCFEPLVYYGRSVSLFSDVYDFPIVFQKDEVKHPTPKPPKLCLKLVADFSKEGEVILDPFLGSGTTAYCAKKLGRKCIGIEVELKYCRIAAERCAQAVLPLESEQVKQGQGTSESLMFSGMASPTKRNEIRIGGRNERICR